jgi:alkanesulfonate monooxygenase
VAVEFIGMISSRQVSEAYGAVGPHMDTDWVRRFCQAYDDGGFDWTLVPYSSGTADALQLAGYAASVTERLKVFVAHRPGVIFPTHAARAIATLDQLSGGRIGVHIISGGNDTEQHREGDYLSKDERYDRAAEYIEILRRTWAGGESFSHEGKYYRFEDFHSDVLPVNGGIPVSVGGSSPAAYRVGGSLGDIFGLWGEPLAETAEQIASVNAQAEAAGRTDKPRIWVSFRPIVAATEELAWERAHQILAQVESRFAGISAGAVPPPNVGSQRLLAAAAKQDLHDRALWTPLAAASGAGGSTTALVGTPETVAQALLDYVDIGCDLLSIRGYDPLNDAIDLGREVIPLVKQELANRTKTPEPAVV